MISTWIIILTASVAIIFIAMLILPNHWQVPSLLAVAALFLFSKSSLDRQFQHCEKFEFDNVSVAPSLEWEHRFYSVWDDAIDFPPRVFHSRVGSGLQLLSAGGDIKRHVGISSKSVIRVEIEGGKSNVTIHPQYVFDQLDLYKFSPYLPDGATVVAKAVDIEELELSESSSHSVRSSLSTNLRISLCRLSEPWPMSIIFDPSDWGPPLQWTAASEDTFLVKNDVVEKLEKISKDLRREPTKKEFRELILRCRSSSPWFTTMCSESIDSNN